MTTQLWQNEYIRVLRNTGAELRDTLKKRNLGELKRFGQQLWNDKERRWVFLIPAVIAAVSLLAMRSDEPLIPVRAQPGH